MLNEITKMSDSLNKALNNSFHIQKSKKVDQTAFGADGDSVVHQLFASYGGVLFAWTDRGLLAFMNIAPHVGTDDALFNVSTTLHLTKIPFGRVLRLEINNAGTHIALMCKDYCYVVEIPTIFRVFKSLNDIESEYLCRCYDVNACEYESKNSAYLCVRWMPDFSRSRFLLTLRSDNTLRIYKIDSSSCNIIGSVFCNGDSAKFTSEIMSTLSNLGETAVSFDIAPCRSCTSNISKAPMYTVFVLHGNGDVYSIILDAFGCRKSPISGPLTMHPPAEDNYGLDSCDIIAISSSKHEEAITCLVIATSYGNLYHCVVESENLEDDDDNFSLNIQFSLYVYENVELESSLSTIDLEKKSIKESTFLSTVCLCKDSFASDVYHCTHNSGIHSIHLEWLKELEIYNKESSDDSDELLTGYDQPCIVKYRLCTTLDQSERLSSVKGFATMFEIPLKKFLLILLPNFSLEIIQPSLELTTLPITQSRAKSIKNIENRNRPNFLDEMKQLLRQNTSTPLLKCQHKSISETEIVQVILRTVDILNVERLDKLKTAHALCLDRYRLLLSTCSKQKLESDLISRKIFKHIEPACKRISNTIDLANQEMNKIRSRIEFLNGRALSKMDSFSSAEVNMLKDLRFMQNQAQLLSEKLERLKQSLTIKNVCGKQERSNEERSKTEKEAYNLQKLLESQNRQIDALRIDLNALS